MSEVVETDGDTVYVIDKQNWRVRAIDAPEHEFRLDDIDWLALAKQKDALLQLIVKERGNKPTHILDGLLSLIDAIQNEGELYDYPVVYAYCRAEWEEEHK